MSCQPGADTVNIVDNAFPLKPLNAKEPPEGPSRKNNVISTDAAEKLRIAECGTDSFHTGVAVNWSEKSGEFMPETLRTKDIIPGLESANGVGETLELE